MERSRSEKVHSVAFILWNKIFKSILIEFNPAIGWWRLVIIKETNLVLKSISWHIWYSPCLLFLPSAPIYYPVCASRFHPWVPGGPTLHLSTILGILVARIGLRRPTPWPRDYDLTSFSWWWRFPPPHHRDWNILHPSLPGSLCRDSGICTKCCLTFYNSNF